MVIRRNSKEERGSVVGPSGNVISNTVVGGAIAGEDLQEFQHSGSQVSIERMERDGTRKARGVLKGLTRPLLFS